MTAGLIQQTSNQAINGLPGLMNLPILGTLFRSRDYQRKETELMILVTPYIAKPMDAAQVKRQLKQWRAEQRVAGLDDLFF